MDILRYFGLGGTLVVIVMSGAAAAVYRGSRGEKFSILNHFVSELGEVGVSRYATGFNASLLVGGALLVPFVIGLGFALNSWLGWLSTLAGTAAGLALAAVGRFPMNDREKHGKAALTYFRTGLAMVCLYGLAFLTQPADNTVVPVSASLLSLVAAACYAGFLFLTRSMPEEATEEEPDGEGEPERPQVWNLAVVEWLVFFSTVGWLFLIAYSI